MTPIRHEDCPLAVLLRNRSGTGHARGGGRAAGRLPRQFPRLSPPADGRERRNHRRARHADRSHAPEAPGRIRAAPGRHRRIVGRRHRQQEPRRHHRELEHRRRAALRLFRRGGDRPVDHDGDTARSAQRGGLYHRADPKGSEGPHLRDAAPAQGRQPHRRVADRLAPQEPVWPGHRSFQDRARHHRSQGDRETHPPAHAGGQSPRQEPVLGHPVDDPPDQSERRRRRSNSSAACANAS